MVMVVYPSWPQVDSKTTWNDVAKLGGKYTQTIATKMCIDAIVATMILNRNSVSTPLQFASVVVKSFPGGPNVCMTFKNGDGTATSGTCFPRSINPVPPNKTPLGKRCDNFPVH